MSQFKELEKTEADTQDTRVKIGLIYFEKGDYEQQAATGFTLVLAAEPKNDRVRYYLASAYGELHDYSRAVEFARVPVDSEYYPDACLPTLVTSVRSRDISTRRSRM